MKPDQQIIMLTNAEWIALDPIVPINIVAWSSDTGVFKIGNGTDIWSDLDYSAGKLIGNKYVESDREPVDQEELRFCSAEDKWIFKLKGCFLSETEITTITTTIYPKFCVIGEVSDSTGYPTGRYKICDGVNTFVNIPWIDYTEQYFDTDGTLTANSDVLLATQKATKTYADTKISLSDVDTDGTLAANSDSKVPSQKAVKTYSDTKIPSTYLDTDGTLSANSDTKIASQKATKTYADTRIPNSYLDTDGTLAANSDTKIATQKSVKTYSDTKVPLTYLDTDVTLAVNSDSKVATQKAVKTHADAIAEQSIAMAIVFGG